MQFKLTIDMENAAFDDGYGGREELGKILLALAKKVDEVSAEPMIVKDTNGNTVGTCVEETQ